MPEYLAYLLDESDEVSGAAIFIREETDEEAIESAKQHVDGHDVELWQGNRRVITLRCGE